MSEQTEVKELRRRVAELEKGEAERKRAEEALQRQKDLAQTYLEIAQVMMVVIDADEKISLINRKCCENLGCQEEDIIGKNWFDTFIPERMRNEVRGIFVKLMAGDIEPGECFENSILTKTGEERIIAWHNAVFTDDTGNISGTLSSGEDITERKRAEEELRESEERFRSLYSAMTEGVCLHEVIFDESVKAVDYRILDVNPSYEAITGIKRADAVGNKASQVYGSGEPPCIDIYAKVAASGEPTFFETYFPPMDKYFSISVFSPGKGKFATVFLDITERKQIELELERHRQHLETLVSERTKELELANIQLKEADRLKTIFLASMSHELRTPLNSIIGFTGILLQGLAGDLNEEQKKQLSMVKNSASHLLGLINDILDISKIEAGKVDLTLEEFKLDDMIKEVAGSFTTVVSDKGLKFETDVPEGITLSNDKRRVKQVLMNLAGNAIKFTEKGKVKVAAVILEKDKVQIYISDTGIGIKQEDMGKLFEPFQQIDASLTKKYEGTGLGLHLTKKLLALLGGDIWVKSEYGKGSEFTFSLPLRLEEARNAKSANN